ncbi:NAD(P)H-quinone oxidoreductase [Corynebacterium uropygiale]|uniref:NAD(P)H-quinone oxidoreductase n=1 Tax=Corynebacterium uropygiale TaxID=1775911 RepID=A0A9X1TZR1_9CORY|nr:NAD(P)H-quinone oxidoreductase [Corynebacterium uropygiale]MCF4005643.1 NAD(P)H-quinone oxidoreductase [Corynebacterium uropygiale]
MQAIVLTDESDPRSLRLGSVPTPQLREGEVLVKVHAAGVNRADINQAQGNYPAPPGESEIIGLECAGTIADPGTTSRSIGEPVCCLLAGGAYAEYVAVPEGQLLPIPEGYSMAEAASIVEVACTVWNNLGQIAGIREGQRVLIHGGSGGIGSFAIQCAAAMGAEVAVTASSEEKLRYCKDLGAHLLYNYRESDWSRELKNTVDIILDVVGGPYLEGNIRALAPGGQLITIAIQGGAKSTINLGLLMMKRLTVRGTTLRSRPREEKATIVAATREAVWPMLADGRIRHHIHETLPLADAARAHELLDSGAVTGKLVLEV